MKIMPKGQAIIALILVMTVALAIGLSIVQKSLVNVSTSTKVEESSRAFSAAEAGIEKALQVSSCSAGACLVDFSANNSSRVTSVTDSELGPAIFTTTEQDPLEYPKFLGKEDIAQVWLADPNSPDNPPAEFYKQSTLDVYWGSVQKDVTPKDYSALELTLVYYGTDSTDTADPTAKYRSRKWYLDNQSATRTENNFTGVVCPVDGIPVGASTYQCKYTLTSLPTSTSKLMLLRFRLLYNETSQPVAVQAVGCCGRDYSLPPQKRDITSIGESGQTQRTVNVSQIIKVVPPYFDYAIFSVGEVRK